MGTEPQSGRVLITGGASGIGFASARRLGRAGARIGIFDLNATHVENARASLAQEGVETLAFTGDVRRRADLAGAADAMTAGSGSTERHPRDGWANLKTLPAALLFSARSKPISLPARCPRSTVG